MHDLVIYIQKRITSGEAAVLISLGIPIKIQVLVTGAEQMIQVHSAMTAADEISHRHIQIIQKTRETYEYYSTNTV